MSVLMHNIYLKNLSNTLLALQKMNNKELKDIVAPCIIGSTITEITEQNDFFIVYFVNNEYCETKDIQLMLVGAGPLLVNKKTKKIFEIGSGQTPTYYIQSYHKTGNINSQPTNIIKIKNYNNPSNKAKAIMLLKMQCSLSTSDAKDIVEKALNAVSTDVEIESNTQAEKVLKIFAASGFVVEITWQ